MWSSSLRHKRLVISTSIAVLSIIILQTISLTGAASAYDSIRYDPENQDGIPIISSRSVAPMANEWGSDEISMGERMPARRRYDEDGLEEDDDDDENQASGSSRHDTIENPAFGESRTAARDAEDIETFFDKHLGPSEAAQDSGSLSDESGEVPISRLARTDPDPFEVAASSPLHNIFHSLLSAHKRPLVITTSGGDDSTSGPDSQASSDQQIVGAANGGPVAYLTPVAAPSSMVAYEPATSSDDGRDSDGSSNGVREIHISRRPSALLSALGSHYSQPTGQSSNTNYWRGRPSDEQAGEQTLGARGYVPIAAYSHAHQQEQADEPQTVTYGLSFGGGAEDDDSQDQAKVAPDDTSSSEENPAGPQVASGQLYQQQMYYAPAGPLRQAASSMRGQQNYQQLVGQPMRQFQLQPMGYQAYYQAARYQKDPGAGYSAQLANNYDQNSRARPRQRASASSPMTQRAVRPARLRPDQPEAESYQLARQQLLASLSDQIRRTPHYRQQTSASQQSASHSPATRIQRARAKPESPAEVSTFSSFHSESDPYKSLVTEARIVASPERQPRREPTGEQPSSVSQQDWANVDLARNSAGQTNALSRVRRDDPDERDDADDDGVWVDDDDDDDGRQQSSDLNETSQEPDEDEEDSADSQQQGLVSNASPIVEANRGLARPALAAGPHSYELSPDDLMIYHG